MKLLWLDNPCGDYFAAMLYLGLTQELGAESVIEWPLIEYYRGPGSPFEWLRVPPGRHVSDAEIFATLASFDLVILASPRPENTDRMRQLIARVGRRALPRFVMCDGEDYSHCRWDLIQEFRPSVYFKTSLHPAPWKAYERERKQVESSVRVVCAPLCTTFDHVEPAEKTIDVCFLGGNNWNGPRREGIAEDRPKAKPILEDLLSRELPEFRLMLGNDHDRASYQRKLAASKIFVCPGGFGLEPVRSYEAMSCPDVFVLREAIQHLPPWPLVDGDTCVTWTDFRDVPALCRHWLAPEREAERLAIARRGNALLTAHYTPRARARQVIEESFR